jgi:glucose/arabinose dehydrogenase/azurin
MFLKNTLKLLSVTLFSIWVASCAKEESYNFNPKEHSSIVIIGNTFAEQLQASNYFETLLYQSFPDRKLKVRNLAWSADEVNLQPRPLNFGDIHQYLEQEKADYIIASYGLNEAFKGKDSLEVFGAHLKDFLKSLQQKNYNGSSPPQIILVSPIAHEEIGGLLPDPTEHNNNLGLYTERMSSVAEELGVPFINLYEPSQRLMQEEEDQLTFNGIHLTDTGYKVVSELLSKALGFPLSSYHAEPKTEELREVIRMKNQHYFYKYRAVNGEYIYGRRNKPYGVESFPAEFEKLDLMVAIMDSVIWAGSQENAPVDMARVHEITHDTVQFEPYNPNIQREEPSTDQFVIKEGYKIELFASEQDFPIGNATTFTFDPKGRLWVATLESFPQVFPGSLPNDKLVILEDKDKDGKADDHVVFADGLYEPLGFELGDGGVYLSQPPNLIFLKDTNDDQRADLQTPLLYGFGTEDVHHTISAFNWGPDGALYMNDGTFLHDQIETPYGPVRSAYATTWRYEPYTQKLTPYISYPYANPWGSVFLRNGMHLIADASGGNNYYATPLTVAIDYPHKHMVMDDFPTTRLRPTCGLEIISSRHFPESVQGHMLQPNIVGFQGIKQYEIIKTGSGVTANEVEPLLQSKDLNFRPVDLQFGPDGALYILDFYNPIVGHMTYSFRDPNRDHVHGRVWRVTYEGKETMAPRDLSEMGIAELLDQLKEYEDRTRYRTRTQLREFDKEEVMAELKEWLQRLEANSQDDDQHRLEALWLHQQFHEVNEPLLTQLLQSTNEDVRAAATRVLFYWKDLLPDAQDKLIKLSTDPSQRVRLEAIVALSHFNREEAVNALLTAIELPLDYYMYYSLNESFKQLRPVWMKMFEEERDFLKGEPKKAFYLLNSVTSPASLAVSNFIKEDPESSKYILKPFDQEDYLKLADAPAIVEFWISKKDVPDSIKLKGLNFLAELEGKEPRQLVNERLTFLKEMEKEINSLLNWKDQTKIKEQERGIKNEELEEDIQALSQLLENHSAIESLSSMDLPELNTNQITIEITALPGQMAFDKKEFTVRAGQKVEIQLTNDDEMQHNLLVINPGTLTQVGEMAEEMAREPDGFEKNFIPDTKDVLFGTPLLDPDGKYSLIFKAPENPGNYPFVCTFPGHWRIMNGIMKVIK